MDTISLPVRYDGLAETDLREHLRHCADHLLHDQRLEVLLCESGVVVPIVKKVHRTKTATLDVLIRSGSIARECLTKLRESLEDEGFEISVSFTSKRKLIQRVVVHLPIDGTITITGLKILESINCALDVEWPTPISVGYAFGTEAPSLPGRLSYRGSYGAGYKVGYAIGKLLKKTIP